MSTPLRTPVLPELVAGDGEVTATFAPDARSWAGVHGGLVVGALLDVAAQATGRVALAVTAHLHAAVDPGQASLTARAVSTGRAVTSVTAALEQGRRRATASVVLVAPDEPARHWEAGHRDVATVPAPEEADRLTGMEEVVPVARYFDIRPVREARPLAGGEVPELTAWVRLLPGAAYRAAVAPVLLDALAPSLYAVGTAPLSIPTVEFTVHLTPSVPVDEWLLVDQRTTWSTGSFCVDEADLVDRTGRLIAQARQLRRILG